MPYKKKRQYKKKRPYKKKSYTRRTMSSVGKTNPFPKTFRTKLRYESSIQLDAGLASSVSHLFRCGSVFDPDYTGVGHQPRYFDQIMPLYDHFTVIGSMITVKAVNNTTDVMVVGVQKSGAPTPPGNINSLIEQRNSVYKWVGNAASNSSIQTIRMKYSPKSFLNIPNPLSSENLRGTIATNPDEDAYFMVTVGSHDASLNPGPMTIRIIIDYIVVFTEPRSVASS